VPFSELVFPMSIAPDVPAFITYTTPANDTSEAYRSGGITFSFIEVGVGSLFVGNRDDRTKRITATNAKVFAVNRHEYFHGTSKYNYDHVEIVSAAPFTIHETAENGYENDYVVKSTYGNYVVDMQTGIGTNSWIPMQEQIHNDSLSLNSLTNDMLRFGNGQGSGDVSVPVQWISPYDGRTFEDSFDITVTTSSGSGYSDDSGGSSSGGGGGF
jgi:hypothetical protein